MHHAITPVIRVVGLLALGLLAGCQAPSSDAHLNRGPESLLDVSSEVVNLSIATKQDLADLTRWVATDAPTRAELQCDTVSSTCREALGILEKKKVAVASVPSASNTVTLVYERILARDCKQRYRAYRTPLYNEHAASHGCAVSANIVQHVSDKSVFINPPLSDAPSARNAVSAVQRANAPKIEPQRSYGINQSLTRSAQQ